MIFVKAQALIGERRGGHGLLYSPCEGRECDVNILPGRRIYTALVAPNFDDIRRQFSAVPPGNPTSPSLARLTLGRLSSVSDGF